MLPGYAPLAGRWKAAQIVLWIAVGLAVLAIVSDALAIAWYSSDEAVTDNDALFERAARRR